MSLQFYRTDIVAMQNFIQKGVPVKVKAVFLFNIVYALFRDLQMYYYQPL